MSTESSQQLMDRYFATMDADGDLGRHLSDDVVWTDTDTGREVRGPSSVAEYIAALHARMADVRGRTFAVVGSTALVEGDCLPLHAEPGDEAAAADRVPYAVVYDLSEDRITAMRLYMAVSRLDAPGT
jgi:SnoaL-like domain